MKKLWIVLFLCNAYLFLNATPVSLGKARQAASNFMLHNSRLKSGFVDLSKGDLTTYNGATTCYTFSVNGGGWIIISADDAATPVLAYSNSGDWIEESVNPTALKWIESYNKEIYEAIQTRQSSSTASQTEWQLLLDRQYTDAVTTVAPLLTTQWDQSKYYNDLCPASSSAPSGYGGHVPTGCVATTMAQIMKYYEFPAQGIGSKTYVHPVYNTLIAQYGSTDYNWNAMTNKVTSVNSAVATLMYHCGVAVDMNYNPESSGAFSEVVPYALKTYFNYDKNVRLVQREDMASDEIWRTLIRTELEASRPVYYAGTGSYGGHAFVCDGFDGSNPTKFHFNWGWGGSNDGYFAIGALNINRVSFNDFNRIIIGIKPRSNPGFTYRIVSPLNNAGIDPGADVNVSVNSVKGTASKMILYVDGVKSDSSVTAPFIFVVKTSGMASGPHTLSVEASNGTDKDYPEATFNIQSTCWKHQDVSFSMDSVNIEQIFPVDENVVWAVLRDYSSKAKSIRKYIKTTNGGTTWSEGTITCSTCSTMEISNIYAFNDTKAYACLNPGNTTGGAILVTQDGGTTWTTQTTANFSNSWANWVYFFDNSNGVCMGDSYKPSSGTTYLFCIYTTSDGGTTWNKVASSNIPTALSNEAGTVNFFDAVGNTIWFGTGNGRIYKSTNKGLTWTVKDGVLGTVQTDVKFRDSNNGFAFGGYGDSNFGFKKTTDGGNTWQEVAPGGPLVGQNLEYVKGTTSTWVNTGIYSSVSLTDNQLYYWLDNSTNLRTSAFLSPTKGWAGGHYSLNDGGGMYKWVGTFTPAYNSTIVLRVKDSGKNAIQGAVAIFNNQVKTTDTKGLASFEIKGFGNPENYKVTKAGYSSNTSNYFVSDNDTVDIVLSPSFSITFNVKNNHDAAISGATVIFNGVTQVTDANGEATFSNIPMSQSNPYAVTKTHYYAGYGLLDVKDSNTNLNIILTGDATDVKTTKTTESVVFPNPASEVLNILSEKVITEIEIISMNGKVVLNKKCSSTTVQIPVSTIRAGEYIVKITKEKLQESSRILIKH